MESFSSALRLAVSRDEAVPTDRIFWDPQDVLDAWSGSAKRLIATTRTAAKTQWQIGFAAAKYVFVRMIVGPSLSETRNTENAALPGEDTPHAGDTRTSFAMGVSGQSVRPRSGVQAGPQH